ncbi:discoidin domain-containing protein [Pseudokineococcus basanitobsidens]|uniref:Discoidin domain-containing protein n=1 Tax=Pseudokineococcus basanitobsidens TaxID=1926649 RepID=A0ABU8RF86_9ACTN
MSSVARARGQDGASTTNRPHVIGDLMGHRRLVAALAAATATALLAGPATAAAPPVGRDLGAPVARVWTTTPDRAQLLEEGEPVAFAPGGSDELTITVDPSRTYQEVDGFGGSITHSSASLLAGLPDAGREAAMRRLFDPDEGVGLSVLRQPMGSSDFVDGPHFTYDDVPAGESDYALEHFSIERDRAAVLPLLREALALQPDMTVVATPWSPPAWMKTSGSLVGGQLRDDQRVYDTYAQYFVRFVEAYAAEGVDVDYVTVQNEPQNRRPDAYPGADVPVADEARLVEAVGRAFAGAGLGTKILGYDHNWATHPDDVATTPEGEDPETDYPYELLASDAAPWLAGTAFHCYYGDPGAQTALHDAFPDEGIWFTECSGSHGADDTPAQYFRGTLTWHARTITVGVMRSWARSAVTWNVALDPQGDPHDGGCSTCTGMLTVDGDEVTTNAEYYTIGHLAKFVRPGAVRVASTSFGTTGWNGEVTDVAFRNPDGSTALVVHNESDEPRTVAVAVAGRSFEHTLPGGALATFTWPGPAGRGLADRSTLLPLGDATATAGGQDAPAVVDDDATTRWSSGAAQTPGQQLVVDLGQRTLLSRVVADTGTSRGDFPRGWRLETSRDGRRWHEAARGTGTGQLTEMDAGPTAARYLRITQTGSAGSWWSVADLRVYR